MKSRFRTALVCGAGGFLGSHVAARLHAEGWIVNGAGRSVGTYSAALLRTACVTYYKGDLSDSGFVQKLFHKVNPDSVIFSAGPADVAASFADPVKDLKAHLLPLAEVLAACRQLKRIPKVLLLSSASVYGNPTELPIYVTSPTKPISPYGYHKLLQEKLLLEYADLYGIPCAIARIFSTYGEGLQRLAVWDITRRAMNGDYTVRGGGGESRDYLCIDDLASALLAILDRASFRKDVFNVASGIETKIVDLANIIFASLGLNVAAQNDGVPQRGNPVRWCADVKALSSLGFKPYISIEDGVPRTVNWIKGNG